MPGTMDIGNHGDDTVTTIALPFPYCLYGNTYTSVNLSSNGNAQFLTNDTAFTNQCLPWTAHNDTICPYWDDLYLVNSGFGIFTSISGTAPNRIFNIEWRAQYLPGERQCQLRAEAVRGAVSLRRDLRHSEWEQHQRHGGSAERRRYFCAVLLQRVRRRRYRRAKLYPDTLRNAFTNANGYCNSDSNCNANSDSHSHG